MVFTIFKMVKTDQNNTLDKNHSGLHAGIRMKTTRTALQSLNWTTAIPKGNLPPTRRIRKTRTFLLPRTSGSPLQARPPQE